MKSVPIVWYDDIGLVPLCVDVCLRLTHNCFEALVYIPRKRGVRRFDAVVYCHFGQSYVELLKCVELFKCVEAKMCL